MAAVRVWPAPEYTRVTIETRDQIRYSVFALEGPDRLVVDLEHKIARLDAYIDRSWPDPLSPNGRRFLQLYSANLGRLSRLYLHRRTIARLQARRNTDQSATAIDRAIDDALDQLAEEWGIQL